MPAAPIPTPTGCTVGEVGEGRGHVPKARGVKRRGQVPQPCSKEGAREDDRHTEDLSII